MVFTRYTVLILVIVVAIGCFSLTRPAVIASDTTEIGGSTVVPWGVGMADILFSDIGAAILTGIWGFYIDSISHLVVASVWVVSVSLLNIVG